MELQWVVVLAFILTIAGIAFGFFLGIGFRVGKTAFRQVKKAADPVGWVDLDEIEEAKRRLAEASKNVAIGSGYHIAEPSTKVATSDWKTTTVNFNE